MSKIRGKKKIIARVRSLLRKLFRGTSIYMGVESSRVDENIYTLTEEPPLLIS